MKKYIAIAALFAAGTAFANAEDSVVLTTTFGNAAQSAPTSVTLTNTWDADLGSLAAVTASVKSLTESSLQVSEGTTTLANVTLQTSNAAGTTETFFAPNNNVGNSTGWEATFSYSDATDLLTISGLNIAMNFFNSTGVWQTAGAVWAGNLVLQAKILSSDGETSLGTLTGKWETPSGKNETGGTNAGANPYTVSLSGSAIDLTDVDSFQIVISTNKENQTNGGFFGMQSIGFVGTAIPEPSAFGLLAGLGALALVGARRRRK